MERYATTIEDGTVYIEGDDGPIEVGSLADIFDIVGSETYTIEYDQQKATAYDWLGTDDEGALSFDVRETIEEMTYPGEFVDTLREKPLDSVGRRHPERTAYFAELLVDIWDSKGALDNREENPFVT